MQASNIEGHCVQKHEMSELIREPGHGDLDQDLNFLAKIICWPHRALLDLDPDLVSIGVHRSIHVIVGILATICPDVDFVVGIAALA